MVMVTTRVDYNTVSTKTTPSNSNNFHSTAHRCGKVRNQSSDLIQVKINKNECKTSSPTYLIVMCMTAQSCRQKTLAIRDAASDNKFDVAFFTEIWLYSQGDEAYMAQMTPEGWLVHEIIPTGREKRGRDSYYSEGFIERVLHTPPSSLYVL